MVIAEQCAKLNKAYFDPTEDTEIAEYVSSCTNTETMMTQCGLAPGAVNIIAADLIKQMAKNLFMLMEIDMKHLIRQVVHLRCVKRMKEKLDH